MRLPGARAWWNGSRGPFAGAWVTGRGGFPGRPRAVGERGRGGGRTSRGSRDPGPRCGRRGPGAAARTRGRRCGGCLPPIRSRAGLRPRGCVPYRVRQSQPLVYQAAPTPADGRPGRTAFRRLPVAGDRAGRRGAAQAPAPLNRRSDTRHTGRPGRRRRRCGARRGAKNAVARLRHAPRLTDARRNRNGRTRRHAPGAECPRSGGPAQDGDPGRGEPAVHGGGADASAVAVHAGGRP